LIEIPVGCFAAFRKILESFAGVDQIRRFRFRGAPLTVHFFITAGNGFSELRFITTDVTTVISGSARRR